MKGISGPQASQVIWSHLVNEVATGSALTGAGTSNVFDAYAWSDQSSLTDISVDYVVVPTQTFSAGLTSIGAGYNPSSTINSVDYGFYGDANPNVYIFENNGSALYTGSAALPGEIFSIRAVSGVVKYYRNSVLVYTSLKPQAGILFPAVALASVGACIVSAQVTI